MHALAKAFNVATFRLAGFDVIPYPVDGWWPFDVGDRFSLAETALKERIGLLAYRGLGRSDALFPRG